MDSTFLRACEAATERWQVPALALGVSVAGRDETLAVGCSADTRFRIASVTKPFTATLALRLLALDDLAGVWPEATVGDLLSHLSGYDCECGDLARLGDGDDALERLVAELPSVRRLVGAREAWSYSNAGYWLAGWLCARAGGAAYEQLLAELISEIGLPATSFEEPGVSGTGPLALPGAYPRARRPSGGLVSTVGDLLRFGRWQLDRPETARMRQPLARPAGGVYGLGMAGSRVGGVDVWGHSGSYGGFQSSFLLIPERGAVIAGLTNSGRGKQALREVEDVVFDRLLGARRPVPDTVPVEPAELAALTGTYASGDERYELSVDGAQLVVTAAGESARARAIGDRTFELVEGDGVRDRFDFPLPGFARIGSRLAERVA